MNLFLLYNFMVNVAIMISGLIILLVIVRKDKKE